MQSSQLKSYLTGLILGDAYLDKGVVNRALRIRTINKDWAKKILNDLVSCTNFKIHLFEHDARVDKNSVNHKKHWEICIEAHPYFAKIYHRFYDDFRNRIIQTESLNSLDWIGWANWFMSDGYIVRVGLESGKIKDRRVQLCTDRYQIKDIEKIQEVLFYNFKYNTSIVKRMKTYRLNIKLESAQNFLLNISPFVVPTMQYKLDMCYDYQPKWMNNEYFLMMQDINKRQTPLFKDDEIV